MGRPKSWTEQRHKDGVSNLMSSFVERTAQLALSPHRRSLLLEISIYKCSRKVFYPEFQYYVVIGRQPANSSQLYTSRAVDLNKSH